MLEWNEISFHFRKNGWILQFFCQILTDFYRNFTKNCRKLWIFYRFWENLPETFGKMPEISGNCADFIRSFHFFNELPSRTALPARGLGDRQRSQGVEPMYDRTKVSTYRSTIEYLLANFRGLVKGSIKADFCNEILVGKLLTRSTCVCVDLHIPHSSRDLNFWILHFFENNLQPVAASFVKKKSMSKFRQELDLA